MSLQQELHRAHKERLLRMSQPLPKPAPEPKPLPVVEFDTMDAWIKRQKAIPLSPATWFSVVDDFEIQGPTVGKVTLAVAQHFGITSRDLKGPYRTASIAYARQVAFYLARKLTNKSFPEIGRRIGDRDHTTVLHGFRKIERLIKSDWTVAYDVAYAELLV